MSPAIVRMVSPKGYAMATMENGRFVFLPSCLLKGKTVRLDEKIEVEAKPGENYGLTATSLKKQASVETLPDTPLGKGLKAIPVPSP